jgi:hypothetical protein
VLEATLYKEIAKAVDHQGVRLADDSLNNFELLLSGADLEFLLFISMIQMHCQESLTHLLQEDGRLLIIVADDLVDNILPVTVHVAI